MKKPKLAAVGTGYFSHYHFDAWRRLDVDMAGVCSLDEMAAAAAAVEYRFHKSFDDFHEMLDKVEPDFVDIITPPDTHLDFVRWAAEERIHAICQKPFTRDSDEAREAARIAADAGIKLIVHENYRFQPWYEAIRAQIEDGMLGDVYQITFRLRPGDGQGLDAYRDRQPYFRDMQRFLIHETAVHLIDVFRFLLGEITSVTAELAHINPDIAGEDAGVVLFGFENGARGVFDGNRNADHAAEDRRRTMGELIVEGAFGEIRLDGDARLTIRRFGENEATPLRYVWEDRGFGGDCVYRLQRHALRAIFEDVPAMNDAEAYLRNVEIEEAVYRSHEEGRRITL